MTLLGSLLLVVGACGSQPPPAAPSLPVETPAASKAIILADIDPEDPAKKIKRFSPLAEYLADRLGEFGITRGRVTIARDIDEMANLLQRGEVDIYFDSPFPTISVQDRSGSEIILRRWKGGAPNYNSVFVALRETGIASAEELVGKVVAFEEPHSTSGFLLPAGSLLKAGIDLREIGGAGSTVAPDEVGYFFSQDEDNTLELLLRGEIDAAGFSNQDYEGLPPDIMPRIVAFGETIAVPRQLVSVRPGLDKGLADKVRELLAGLDQTEEGRTILKNLKSTKKFDPLPAEATEAMAKLKALMKLVAEN